MKINLKRISTGVKSEFENRKELLNFARDYIENMGVINNKQEEKLMHNNSITISEILDVLSEDYYRI